MARKPKKNIEPPPDGAPEWMVTFSDCMTLLLTFFVLMLSYSTFEKQTLRDLGDALGRSQKVARQNDNIKIDPVVSSVNPKKTEPSLNQSTTPSNTTKKKKNSSDVKKNVEFKNLKVFTIPSREMFWGKTFAFTPSGKEVLDALHIFLEHIPSRIVVSEFSQTGSDELNFERTNAIAEYLISKGVNKEAVNISNMCLGGNEENRRMVEITLIERSIYE